MMNYKIKSMVPYLLQALLLRLRALLLVLRWRRLHSASPPPMFFVIGCGRSGNTLLRSMLMAGGEVAIPPESYVLPRALALYQAYAFLPWPQLASLVIAEFEAFPEFLTWKTDLSDAHRRAQRLPPDQQSFDQLVALVYQAYRDQHFPHARLMGDKTPINTIFLRRLLKAFPEAKFIHILRDPRACVASYKKAGLGRGVSEAVEFWQVATQNAQLAEQLHSGSFIRVEYEKLVTEPEIQMRRLTDFLGIAYTPTMLEFWKSSELLGDVGSRSHHEAVKSPLNARSIDIWAEQLSSTEVSLIEKECLAHYQQLTTRSAIQPGVGSCES